jgi:stearoyl-CoA desaturase (delta-9 desaturase)
VTRYLLLPYKKYCKKTRRWFLFPFLNLFLPTKETREKSLLLFMVIAPFVGTIFAMWRTWRRLTDWKDVLLLIVTYIPMSLGVTVGFHRLATHRSFNPHPLLKHGLLVTGHMALEGPVTNWASTHLEHHAKADKKGDPHSPMDGFFHAHVGWIIDRFQPNIQRYGRFLLEDPVVCFHARLFPLYALISVIFPFFIRGWRGMLWGSAVRIFLVHHVTWSVNSICHTFGDRPYDTNDTSRNFVRGIFGTILVILGLGEPNHNGHHNDMQSYEHADEGDPWYRDLSARFIEACEALGLAEDLEDHPKLRAARLRQQRASSGTSTA